MQIGKKYTQYKNQINSYYKTDLRTRLYPISYKISTDKL